MRSPALLKAALTTTACGLHHVGLVDVAHSRGSVTYFANPRIINSVFVVLRATAQADEQTAKGANDSDHPILPNRVGTSDEVSNAIAALAFGFAHPLRVRLIRALEKERGSAKSFSQQFGDVELGDCSYHLNVLKRFGFIELYDNRPARGATERIFQLVPRREWARLWPSVSTSAIGTLRSGLLRQFVISILEEADSAALDDHGEVGGVTRQIVDLQGLQEIARVVEGVHPAVERIARESRARIETHGPSSAIGVLVGIASVPIPQPSLPPDQHTPDSGQA